MVAGIGFKPDANRQIDDGFILGERGWQQS